MENVYVFDATISDALSKVRGIGRYVQLLYTAFETEFHFTNNLSEIKKESTFIHTFFNPIQPPLTTKRIAQKQIAVIHDVIPLKYPHYFPIGIRGHWNVFQSKRALKQYDVIVTDSEVSKRDIISLLNVPPEKVTVIYPVLPDNFFTSPTQSAHHNEVFTADRRLLTADYCIYVGDATWNKNLVNIAKAVQKTTIPCVFVGKVFASLPTADGQPLTNLNHPWQKELKQFAKLVHDDNRFIFPGYISDQELLTLYKNALVNMLISRDEGFGFSYFEAAAQKTPSILADRSIFHETAGETAVFVHPEKPDEIAAKIHDMQQEKEFRNDLGKKAYDRIKTFTIPLFKQNWEKVLES